MNGSKALTRSRYDKIIGEGVAGGLAEYFHIDSTIVRVLFVLFAYYGIGFWVYIILWIILPYGRNSNMATD